MNVIVTMEEHPLGAEVFRAVKAALEYEKIAFDCEVEVLFVSPEEMRAINAGQRGIDRVTDVLSFPMLSDLSDPEPDPGTNAVFLGSMVICEEKAKAQAEEYGHSFERELAFLAVHSVLHLLGYDHETGADAEKQMFTEQEAILKEMGLKR